MEYNVNALPLHTTFYVPEGHWVGRIIEENGVRYMACYGSHNTDPLDCVPENEVIRHVITPSEHLMRIVIIEQAETMRHDPRLPFLRNFPTPDLSAPRLDFELNFFDYEYDDDVSFFIGEANIGYLKGRNVYSPLHGENLFYPTGHIKPDQSVIAMPGEDRGVWMDALKRRLADNHAEACRLEEDIESLITDYGKVDQARSQRVIADIIEETLTLQRDLLHLQQHIQRQIRDTPEVPHA